MGKMDCKIFGCKVNKYYVNQWLDYFSDQPMGENNLLIGTCEVTDRAKKKWLKKLTNALDKGRTVYLSGCGVFDDGECISKEKLYDLYPQLVDYDGEFVILPEVPPVEQNDNFFTDKEENIYTKKFIAIQSGCDGNCSFCLSTKKRGDHRSRDLEKIIEEVNSFFVKGGKEINLTGVNMMAWGADSSNNPEDSDFNFLLKKILEKTDIPRIRLSSLGPEFLDDEFFKIIQNDRIMPHFHVSAQTFSDRLLENMNRNYGAQTLENIFQRFQKMRENNKMLSLGADILVGFPGAKEKDMKKTIEKIKEFQINKLHVFPFSDHSKRGPDVPACKFEDKLYYHEVKEKSKKVRKEGKKVRQKFKDKCEGKQSKMLVEYERNGKRYGWTDNYIRKSIQGDYEKGEIISVEI